MSNDVLISTPPESGAPGFQGLGLTPELLSAVVGLGFTTPTDVQAQAIPHGLAGRDVLCSATTGSGKTAAFALPILQRLQNGPRARTRALILTPTRELAAQVAEHFNELGKQTRLKCAVIHGGVAMKPQEMALRKGVEIIVATPGRLLDHLQYPYARMPHIEVLVLDEADRMLDMGFLPAVRRIVQSLPAVGMRQTMLFSATLPTQIVGMAREMMSNPIQVGIQRKTAPATGITQALYPVPQLLKPQLLIELLNRNDIGNAIVFCRTKHRANRLAEKLTRAGISAAPIHGNKSQNQRTQALQGFKDGSHRVLVATDIVARGIDITALEHVINFDVPNAVEDYVHRIGRTARAEATGDAYTLVSPEEEQEMKDIERALGRQIERRKVEGFDYAAPSERLEQPGREFPRGRGNQPRANTRRPRSRARA